MNHGTISFIIAYGQTGGEPEDGKLDMDSLSTEGGEGRGFLIYRTLFILLGQICFFFL